jgi:predicted transcriptional regulator
MKLNSDSETLAANKVLILYVLDLVKKPISNDTLYTIVNTAENMNYFYFQQFLLDLQEAKYITTYENDVQEVIEITDEGKKTLDLTIDLLPGIVKLKADTNYKSTIEKFNNAESITAEFTPKSEKEYEVECKIVENGEIIFDIKTLAFSREQAQDIVDNWKKNAGTLYPSILSELTEHSDEE